MMRVILSINYKPRTIVWNAYKKNGTSVGIYHFLNWLDVIDYMHKFIVSKIFF